MIDLYDLGRMPDDVNHDNDDCIRCIQTGDVAYKGILWPHGRC